VHFSIVALCVLSWSTISVRRRKVRRQDWRRNRFKNFCLQRLRSTSTTTSKISFALPTSRL